MKFHELKIGDLFRLPKSDITFKKVEVQDGQGCCSMRNATDINDPEEDYAIPMGEEVMLLSLPDKN